MKVVVTGGAGFIGSHLVDRLVDDHKVLVIDNLSTGSMQNINPQACFFHLDITDAAVEDLFRLYRPDVVFHLAAQVSVAKSMQDPFMDLHNNITGSLNIFEKCARYGTRKVIFSSSAAVYGEPRYLGLDEKHPIEPISCYGVSKYAAEHYLAVLGRLYGFKYTILRYANVYGPRQLPSSEAGVVTAVTTQLLNGHQPTVYGSGEQTRDFVYIADVVEATRRSVSQADGEVINVGTGTAISVNELIATTQALIGSSIPSNYQSPRLGDILHSYMDVTKAERVLGWRSEYSLFEGLEDYIKSISQ